VTQGIAVTQDPGAIVFDAQLNFCPRTFPQAARAAAARLSRRLRAAQAQTTGGAGRSVRISVRTTGLPVTPAALFGS